MTTKKSFGRQIAKDSQPEQQTPPDDPASSTVDPFSVVSRTLSTQPASPADYIPARQLNEFTYCPRLFYYEYVEGVFVHNRETVEGEIQHRRVDAKEDELPPAEELIQSDRPARMRSVSLSSNTYGVIAKMDLAQFVLAFGQIDCHEL